MTQAFVSGLDRPTFDKPELPAGQVRLIFHGRVGPNGKFFQRPIPLEHKGYVDGDGVQVDKDGIGIFSQVEWEYFQKVCPEAFTRYVKPIQVEEEVAEPVLETLEADGLGTNIETPVEVEVVAAGEPVSIEGNIDDGVSDGPPQQDEPVAHIRPLASKSKGRKR